MSWELKLELSGLKLAAERARAEMMMMSTMKKEQQTHVLTLPLLLSAFSNSRLNSEFSHQPSSHQAGLMMNALQCTMIPFGPHTVFALTFSSRSD